MAKLYPPYITENQLAFAGNTLTLGYELNRAVGPSDYKGLVLKIKTLYTDTTIVNEISRTSLDNPISFNVGSYVSSLTQNQKYKIQIAFMANDSSSTTGYFSQPAIVKYLGSIAPSLSYSFNNGVATLTYSSGSSTNEYLYSIDFKAYSNSIEFKPDTIIAENGQTTFTIDIPSSFAASNNGNFNYVCNFTTINNYKSVISGSSTYSISFNGTTHLSETFYPEGAYNVINWASGSSAQSGTFKIMRKETNGAWELVANQVAATLPFTDYTVEHGKKYDYYVDNGTTKYVTNRYYINEHNTMREVQNGVITNFEDMYLYDGAGRQLKIKFNPSVTGFTEVVQETKIDTLGSKYPFFSRNGDSEYKQFQINGLISMLMDENALFFNVNQSTTGAYRANTPSSSTSDVNNSLTDLNDTNIYNERRFKLEVLKWLNNGEKKYFRSPTEGNYIVRLMNISLTPIDSLGRMLHSFSAQAYECESTHDFKLKEIGGGSSSGAVISQSGSILTIS